MDKNNSRPMSGIFGSRAFWVAGFISAAAWVALAVLVLGRSA